MAKLKVGKRTAEVKMSFFHGTYPIKFFSLKYYIKASKSTAKKLNP